MGMVDVQVIAAGPAVDAACAEVRGWHIGRWSDETDGGMNLYDAEGNYARMWSFDEDPKWRWSPSTDVAAAWELVEVMQGQDYIVKFWSPNREGIAKIAANSWEVAAWKAIDQVTGELYKWRLVEEPEEWTELNYLARASTAPLAISRLFLLVHGITEIEVADD